MEEARKGGRKLKKESTRSLSNKWKKVIYIILQTSVRLF